MLEKVKLAVIGLGYVGLPLAAEFGKKITTLGFDINAGRVDELTKGIDKTLEVSPEELQQSDKLSFSCDVSSLSTCNVYIVTVPTPIDDHKRPDLTPLVKASEMLGKALSRDDVVIYESTVYPGDKEHRVTNILKITSGSTPVIAEFIDQLYLSVIEAGTP